MIADNVASSRRGSHQVRGRLIFRFAVVTDTHVNHEEAATTSPWPVNKLANGRVRHALRTVNALNPEFVVHVGDMVHPTPTQKHYAAAVERFFEVARELRCPIHLTPGNHDIGDKRIEWTPAKPITSETLAIYEKAFGPSYHSFMSHGCLFVVLNSLLLGSGLQAEREQWAWLEGELDRGGCERIFVFIHDPLFTTDPGEAESYDNISVAERERLMALFVAHKVEAVISGHVHNFWYNRLGETELYILPSTTFVRQDYSELYKIEPGDEGGRNDTAKLGVAAVDVYEHGHVLHVIRTNGLVAAPNSTQPIELADLVHTKAGPFLPVGFDLRHPWAETMEIAPSGGVDEFGRKRARNDYPLQAFWEMGIAKLRVPVQDLADENIRARMRLMIELGHEFTVYSYGLPRGSELEAVTKHADLISILEVILSRPRMAESLERLADIKAALPFRVHLSKIRTAHTTADSNRHFAHAVNHGFTLEDAGEIEALVRDAQFRRTVDGLAYRVARDCRPIGALPAICDFSAQHGLDSSIQVRLAAENPSDFMRDDAANADRVADTLLASLLVHSGTSILLDTFDDVDRGFFRRSGLYDRRFNPKMASRVFQHLQAVLRRMAGAKADVFGSRLPDGVTGVETAAEVLLLLKSNCETDVQELRSALGSNLASSTGEIVDLVNGATEEISGQSRCLSMPNPALLRFERLPKVTPKKAVEEGVV